MKDNEKRYRDLLHAVQSGIAAKMNYDGGPDRGETSPKHLRVGVNSALIGNAALVTLLADKGLITEDEYIDALVVCAEREKTLYETWLQERLGTLAIHLA